MICNLRYQCISGFSCMSKHSWYVLCYWELIMRQITIFIMVMIDHCLQLLVDTSLPHQSSVIIQNVWNVHVINLSIGTIFGKNKIEKKFLIVILELNFLQTLTGLGLRDRMPFFFQIMKKIASFWINMEKCISLLKSYFYPETFIQIIIYLIAI